MNSLLNLFNTEEPSIAMSRAIEKFRIAIPTESALSSLPVAALPSLPAAPPPLPPVHSPLARLTPARVTEVMPRAQLEEYAAVAEKVGVEPNDLAVENFKLLLQQLDFPVYALSEVVRYMDAKAQRDSRDQAGWAWHPLRNKDQIEGQFGTLAERRLIRGMDGGQEIKIIPASDAYTSASWNNHSTPLYTHLVPLHALKRIVAIEEHYQGDLAFMVSDYVLAAHVPHPDPFLMAVIPNARLRGGSGRFVIDFWDEPGFGLEEMLAK